MYEHGMIAPVVALVIWSMIMLIWLYGTRIPAMQKAKIKPGEATKAQMEALPGGAPNVANNYNHLMEQPTLFYAIALALSLLSVNAWGVLALAWAYVALRVIHSLVQALGNRIEIRFALFVLSNVPLFALTVVAAVEFAGRMAFA